MKSSNRGPVAGEGRASRRLSGAATIKEVAEHAGVSPMTVSRVINGEQSVKSTTREAVNLSIRTLNYTPNPAARSLAGASVVRIGLLYSNPSSAYLSEFLVGSLDQCSRDHLQLIIEKCDVEGEEHLAAERLANSGIDGVILPPPLCDKTVILKVFSDHRIPVVAVATGEDRPAISTVRIDDFEAARSMTRHLLTLGHRNIGFIMGHPNQTASTQRCLGYMAALKEADIAASPALIAQGFFNYQSGMSAATQLLERVPRPTAIFASNDDMAAAVIAVAHKMGLEVPTSLTVCGFDDSPLATTIWPELTTIRQPIADMSRKAVTLLAQEIRSRRSGNAPHSRRAMLEFALIHRQSDAPPS
jgi:LacI family transcriptional regulator